MKLLFTTPDYQYLADELLDREDNEFTEAKLIRDVFPDGERYLCNPNHVKGTHCVILSGTQSLENIFEIVNLAYQLTTNGASKLTIVIPYFGYQTMERISNPGEVVMAKTMAHWLSSIPRAAYGNEVIMLELHTDAISNYFSPDVTTRAIASTDVVMQACVELAGTDFVLGSTDVGRAKAIEYIQRAFTTKGRGYNVDMAFVYKRRSASDHSKDNTEVTGVNADVKDRIVVIYDDMIRTGGSLMKAAKIYREAGASEVYAVTTHGVLPGIAAGVIRNSDLIKKIALTNSHPVGATIGRDNPNYYRLYSIAGLLSRYI